MPKSKQEPGQLSTEDPYENVARQPSYHHWDIPQHPNPFASDSEADEEYQAVRLEYNQRLQLAGIKRKRNN